MQENLQESKVIEVISGEVGKIIYPESFGFDDLKKVGFFLKKNEKESIFCEGESFELFQTENVTLKGETVSDEKYNTKKFVFTSIKIDFSKERSIGKFLKFICGKDRYEKIYQDVLKKSGRRFENKFEEQKFIEKRIYSIFESEDAEQVLLQVKGITRNKIKDLCQKYKTSQALKRTYDGLSEYGVTLKDALKLTKQLGNNAIEIVLKNPFQLMRKCNMSFNKCDIIFSKQKGSNPNDLKRLMAAITYSLNHELQSGHTYSYKDYILEEAKKMLSALTFNGKKYVLDFYNLNQAFNILLSSNKIIDDNNKIYLGYIFEMEKFLREYVSKNITKNENVKSYQEQIEAYEKNEGIKFGKEQKEAIENSMNQKVSVITGGPGTGKTSSLACIIKLIMDEGIKKEEIALCAPTGKAAQRMKESIGKQIGLEMDAKTIHSLLEVDPESMQNASDDDEVFIFNKNHRLPYSVVVVDETSMLDLKIAYSLVSALRDDAKIIFVGDIEQLPPVGYGYFLRDLIESHVPTVKLLEIHRQKGDSTIISLSQAIRDGVLDCHNVEYKFDYGFYNFKKEKTYEEKMFWIVNSFLRSVKDTGLDETMILTPLKGDSKTEKFGAEQICLAIQKVLLPDKEDEISITKNGWVFKIGSKVIVTKNNNQKNIVNGEIGYITDINLSEKTITIEFEGSKIVELNNDEIEDLRLGYAITVHKSQGSEWKNVIYCCFSETKMNKKPLVYTAITRAKSKLIIAGDVDTFLNCIYNKEAPRRSRLLN